METRILDLSAAELEGHAPALARILAACVEGGAAVGFMAPLPLEEAERFWLDSVRPELAAGRRLLFVATQGAEPLGTVQLILSMPANQPHRCEIAKMMVDPRARRLGIGRALMLRALERAESLGKSLVTLDTRTGDRAEPLYASVGFAKAGEIPDYAWNPDGRAKHATSYMHRRIGA